MAHVIGLPLSPEANAGMDGEKHSSGMSIHYKPVAGSGSYLYLGSNPNAKFYVSKVKDVLGMLRYVDSEHVAMYLEAAIPDAFQQEAEKNGLTPIHAMELLKAKLEEIERRRASDGSAQEVKALATMIASVAPSLSPQELGERFKKLSECHLGAALDHLARCEQKNGRNEEGYIYLRAQKES